MQISNRGAGRTSQWILSLVGCALVAASACGGTTGSGGGAGGGDGGNGGNGGNLTSTTTDGASASSSSTGGQSLCQQYCDSQTAKGCGIGALCLDQCQHGGGPQGACTALHDTLLKCLIDATTCPAPLECLQARTAYGNCVAPTVAGCSQECTTGISDGNCTCDAKCTGVTLTAECAPGTGKRVCTCLKDGSKVGSCTEAFSPGQSCEFVVGCCLEVFFPSP
jgi:hypothetical protein